jgi:hypothetical protein
LTLQIKVYHAKEGEASLPEGGYTPTSLDKALLLLYPLPMQLSSSKKRETTIMDEHRDRRKAKFVNTFTGHTIEIEGSKHISQVKSETKFTRKVKGFKLLTLLFFIAFTIGYQLLLPWIEKLKIWHLINYGS